MRTNIFRQLPRNEIARPANVSAGRARREAKVTVIGIFIVAYGRPQSIDDDSRVIRFRPRQAASRGLPREKAPRNRDGKDDSPVADLAKYEHVEADDYRHRMVMNAIAMAFALILILIGIWLANGISHV
jgi:hypothetical protein